MGTIVNSAAYIIKGTIIDASYLQYRDSSPITSKGEGWINPNPMIVKPKSKSLKLKEFDSWPKLDPKRKWNANLTGANLMIVNGTKYQPMP